MLSQCPVSSHWIHGGEVLRRFSGSKPLSLNSGSTHDEWPCSFYQLRESFYLHFIFVLCLNLTQLIRPTVSTLVFYSALTRRFPDCDFTKPLC